MTDEHPITPPLELKQQWEEDWLDLEVKHKEFGPYMADRGAQWGADQELDACCALMDDWGLNGDNFRAARRPKPPSLKKQMLARTKAILNDPNRILPAEVRETLELNQRALEALPDE